MENKKIENWGRKEIGSDHPVDYFFHLVTYNKHSFMSVPWGFFWGKGFSNLSVNSHFSGFLCAGFLQIFCLLVAPLLDFFFF